MRVFELASELKIKPEEIISVAKKNKIVNLQLITNLSATEINTIKQAFLPDSSAGRLKKKIVKKNTVKTKSKKVAIKKSTKSETSTSKAIDKKDNAKIIKTVTNLKSDKTKVDSKSLKNIALDKSTPTIGQDVDTIDKKTIDSKNKKIATEAPLKKINESKVLKQPIKKASPPKPSKDSIKFIRKAQRKPTDEVESNDSKKGKIKLSPSMVSYKFNDEYPKFRTKKNKHTGSEKNYYRGKYKQFDPRNLKSNKTNKKITETIERKKDIVIPKTITVGELSNISGIKAGELIKKLFQLEIMVNINQFIDSDTAQLICQEFGVSIKVEEFDPESLLTRDTKNAKIDIRPPVVTIMGHVDHGKTSLLDKIRKTDIVGGEAGGITQHIGAYFVNTNEGSVTFLDTPGHEAFTAMRSRGAVATDIVVLVVAADDGPKPQTIEAINHAKAANVPILVAINKCDRPNADPELTRQKLMETGLIAESFGGNTTMVNVSSKTGDGIDELLSLIILQAQTMDLKADYNGLSDGIIIESRQDRVRGNIVSFLVLNGILKVGDIIIAGTCVGKVRAMHDSTGKQLNKVLPSHPVEILGIDLLPNAGDKFWAVDSEKTVRTIQHSRLNIEKAKAINPNTTAKMEDIFEKLQSEKKVVLNLILKTDVHGSLEAIQSSLAKWNSDKIEIKYLHAAVGAITSSDVSLAIASNAIIIGFNVRPDGNARVLSEQSNVQIKLYNIIYNLFDDIKSALEGMIEPVIYEEEQGKAEVLDIFTIPKIGAIAGCKVTKGKINTKAKIRVIRDNVVIYSSKIKTLKRFKDDVKEVSEGFECGILLETNKDLKKGDLFESYFEIEKNQKLS